MKRKNFALSILTAAALATFGAANANELSHEPTPGADVQKTSDDIIKTPKEVVDLTIKAFNAFSGGDPPTRGHGRTDVTLRP